MREILGISWTDDQKAFARKVQTSDRVAVKAGHSVGKTQAVGGIVVWFLHCYQPAIVVTTAPSTDQVIKEIWMEVRKQARGARVPLLPGMLPKRSAWDVEDGWYAQGLCTDKGERFRGKHGPNMLFLLDEGNGLPHFVWEEADNMCTAPNNKIVTIGNPINPAGEFYEAFAKPQLGWDTMTISCLDHPNVVLGRQMIPGAVSRKWVEKRIAKHALPLEAGELPDPMTDFEWPRASGVWYHPNPVFQARVLGQFPSEGPDTLIPLHYIDYARTREPILMDESAPVDLGLDVAYQGGDYCVLFARRGPCVIGRWKWRGRDPEKSKREVAAVARGYTLKGVPVGTIAVDAIGIGSGVAYGLQAMRDEGDLHCQRVLAIQVSERANDPQKYENKRAELSFGLAERFKGQGIDLTRLGEDGDDFESQAAQIKWDYGPRLRYRIESKDKMRERTGVSPDDFDGLMLAFTETTDLFAESYADVISAA